MSSGSKTSLPVELRELADREVNWQRWERLISENGITIERPQGSRHPNHPSIIYPIDYGYVNDTVGADGHELDIFVGSSSTGLVGTMVTVDHRKRDTEYKLIYNSRAEEVYLINGFINFDRELMEGVLILRWDMEKIREMDADSRAGD